MQIGPIKPTLKAPGTKRLKLKCDVLLSNVAFKFNLRRYIKVVCGGMHTLAIVGGGLVYSWAGAYTRIFGST